MRSKMMPPVDAAPPPVVPSDSKCKFKGDNHDVHGGIPLREGDYAGAVFQNNASSSREEGFVVDDFVGVGL